MRKFLLALLVLFLMKPVYLSDDDSSNQTQSSSSAEDSTPAQDENPSNASEGDSDDGSGDEEPAADSDDDNGENNHNLGVLSYSSYCMNNVPPCRDECCKLNWWGRRRCCYWKPWAPCCGGFQWHFPGYMVASTWEGAVPNDLGHHYHHGHGENYDGAISHNHPHSH